MYGSLRRITKTEYARNNAVSLSKAGGYVGMGKDAEADIDRKIAARTAYRPNSRSPGVALPKGKEPTSTQSLMSEDKRRQVSQKPAMPKGDKRDYSNRQAKPAVKSDIVLFAIKKS